MQQNISIFIDYLFHKNNSKKKNALLNIILLQRTPRDGAIDLLKL